MSTCGDFDGGDGPVSQPDPPPQPIEPLPIGEVVPDDRLFYLRSLDVNYASGNWSNPGQEVEIVGRFLGGRNVHDSIVVTTSPSTAVSRTGDFTWVLSPLVSTAVTVKIIRSDVLDQNDELKDVERWERTRVQVGAPGTVPMPSTLFDGTNRTASLNAFLASTPDGSIIEGIIPEGSAGLRSDYIAGAVNRWDLSFQGDVVLYTDLDASDKTDALRKEFRHLNFTNGGRISFDGWTIRGPAPDGAKYTGAKETQHGIALEGVNGFSFKGAVRNVYGDGMSIGFEPNHSDEVIKQPLKYPGLVRTKFGNGLFIQASTRNAVIYESEFKFMKRQMFGITAAIDLLMEDLLMEDGERTGWDIEPGGNWLINDNQLFRRCIVRRCGNLVGSIGGTGDWVQDITWEDITVEDKGFRWNFPGGPERRNLYLLNSTSNQAADTREPLITVGNWRGEVHIIGNTGSHERPFYGDDTMRPAIDLDNCPVTAPNLVVEGNTWTDADGDPLPLEFRQTHYQGNKKANGVCRVIEKLNGGEPVVTVGSASSCDWD